MESHSLGTLFADLALVAGLILLAALFVAAEIALISLRESQIRQIAGRGKRGARVAKLAENPNRFQKVGGVKPDLPLRGVYA